MENEGAVREGFSLVEVIIAIVILSFGLLALASTMGAMTTLIRVSDLRTERSAAVQHVVEGLRADGMAGSLTSSSSGSDSIGVFGAEWSVETCANDLCTIQVITSGPGYASGRWTSSVVDTFETSVPAP